MTKKTNVDTYQIACIGCFKHTTALSMFPHRKDGHMVGWVFACPKCWESVAGGEINLIRAAPPQIQRKEK